MGERDLPGTDGAGRACLAAGCSLEVRSHRRRSQTREAALDRLYALARRIAASGTEAELSEIEGEIDKVLQGQRADDAEADKTALDTALNVAAHRLENLIHERRVALAAQQYGTPTA